ncbi:Hpt domain-containing protein, partial [Mesorhizobium sp. LSJC280B00]|uniref:Hpt domain-containing protein n=2 Tax=unclassified Mesorhizobium TaxID=325217 RepID=UPI0004CE7B52
MSGADYSQFSMLDLFRAELETQSQALTSGLLALERDPVSAQSLDACMRAAHSLKGAARIVDLTPAVEVAHAMEECLVAAQRGRLSLSREHIDTLLKGVDLLGSIASEPASADESAKLEIAGFLLALEQASSPSTASETELAGSNAAPQEAPWASSAKETSVLARSEPLLQ